MAVSCELSLHPEMRTYKNDVRRYCVGNSQHSGCVKMFSTRKAEGFSGPPCPIGM